ncbi:MAG: NAD(P)/FAD-dependent oxidoreductase [Dehalococcoidia bacterium]|nr:NAD(P)/FAD-dependent oxidoreductase [Dehalococcoidia bacterium]
MKVIIIGAGVGGLAAAHELAKRGHAVAVVEAGPIAGGQVRTFNPAGNPAGVGPSGEQQEARLEAFYHHLFRSDTDIVALIDELGLGADLAWIDSNVGLAVGGKNYPFIGALDLLRFDRVSWLTRLRLGLTALWLRRFEDWPRYEGTRAAEWIRRWVGREGYDAVWGPLLRAKFGEHAEDVALVWFWGKIHLRFASRSAGERGAGGGGPLGFVRSLLAKEQLGYLRGSFGRLTDALVAAIAARGGTLTLGAPVERVIVEDGRAVGVRLGGAHAGEELRADAVLATVPSGLLARIAPEIAQRDPRYGEMLAAVQYQWATVLVLALDRPLSSIYWLTMTDADCPFVVAVEQTNFMSASDYGGRHIVYLSNYVDPGDPIIDETEAQVLDRYERYLRRINPAFDRAWILESWWFKDRAGQPIVHWRYHETIPPHRTPIAGLYLANTAQVYPEDRGQNYSIRMGVRVARLLEADAAAGAATERQA